MRSVQRCRLVELRQLSFVTGDVEVAANDKGHVRCEVIFQEGPQPLEPLEFVCPAGPSEATPAAVPAASGSN